MIERFRRLSSCIYTKGGYNFTLHLYSIGNSKKQVLDDGERDAESVLRILKAVLPYKTFLALHKKIANEASRQIWVKKKKKRYPRDEKEQNKCFEEEIQA
jgi:hypothetical protein